MKTYSFLLLLAVVACKPQSDIVRDTTNNHRQNPPGTAFLRDSLYMDEAEVTNFAYLEYLRWLYPRDTAAYHAALPDTTVWMQPHFYNEPYTQYYLRHPAYREYPVVGVSYGQAVAYCKWRTERVKEMIASGNKKEAKKYAGLKNFEYRLPTKAEWEYAAAGGLKEPPATGSNVRISEGYDPADFGYESITDRHNRFKVWTREAYVGWQAGVDLLNPVKSKSPNRYGLYNMIGNVSEMLAEKGIAKGGSAMNKLQECKISNDFTYTKPTGLIGFRCVCVVRQ